MNGLKSVVVEGPWGLQDRAESMALLGFNAVLLPVDSGNRVQVAFVVPGGIFSDPRGYRGRYLLTSRIIANNGHRLAIQKGWSFDPSFFSDGSVFAFGIPGAELERTDTWEALRGFLCPSRDVLESLFQLEYGWLGREWEGLSDSPCVQVSRGIFHGSVLAEYPFNCLFHGDDLGNLDLGSCIGYRDEMFSSGNARLVLVGRHMDAEFASRCSGFGLQSFSGDLVVVAPRDVTRAVDISPRGGCRVETVCSGQPHREYFFGIDERACGDSLKGDIIVSLVVSSLQPHLHEIGGRIQAYRSCSNLTVIRIVFPLFDEDNMSQAENSLMCCVEALASEAVVDDFRRLMPDVWADIDSDVVMTTASIQDALIKNGLLISLGQRLEALRDLSVEHVHGITSQIRLERCVKVDNVERIILSSGHHV